MDSDVLQDDGLEQVLTSQGRGQIQEICRQSDGEAR